MVPRNSISEGFAYIWQSNWVAIIVMKTERRQIHFLSDVFAAIASLDLTVPIIIIADITVLVFIIIIVIILSPLSSQLSFRVIISSSPLSLFRYRYCLSLLISLSFRIEFCWGSLFQLLKYPVVQGIFSENSNPRQKSLKHPYISLSLYNVQIWLQSERYFSKCFKVSVWDCSFL